MSIFRQLVTFRYQSASRQLRVIVRLIGLSLALSNMLSAEAAQPLRLSSGAHVPALLEVYSSHGCSSCPPAQAWLSQYQNSPDLWQKLIPMVFHVDYWDYIGWRDPFAHSRYSERQRDFARKDLINSVYTPGFIVNGKEWTAWFKGHAITNKQSSTPSSWFVQADLHPNNVRIQYRATREENSLSSTSPAFINVAILGFNLKTDVTHGENEGKTLEDDFVVLGYKRHAITHNTMTVDYPSIQETAPKYAVTIWLTSKDELSPLQAVGGYVPDDWHF